MLSGPSWAVSSLLPGALALLLAAAAGAQPLAPADRAKLLGAEALDAGVVERLESHGKARVLVSLRNAAAAGRLLAQLPEEARLRRYARAPALALLLGGAQLARLLDDPDVARVGLDARVRAQLDQSRVLSHFEEVHARGYTGAGVTVGYLDTGIDTDHPNLLSAIAEERCWCDAAGPGMSGCCPNGESTQTGSGAAEDDNSHGTRVAGVMHSEAGPFGAAPDASLLVVKALDSNGSGFLSDIIAGLDWILDERPEVAVVSLSFGFGPYPGVCDAADANTQALADAIDPLHARGTLVVAGSGNDRSGTGMLAPACLANVFSVGAVWDDTLPSQAHYGCTDPNPVADQVTCWSNSNALTDVFAPGGRILVPDIGGGVNEVVGTSYAGPHAAACAALLLEAAPGTAPDDLRVALRSSPKSVTDPKNGLSFPRLDCRIALKNLVNLVPAMPTGRLAWPLLAALLGATARLRLRRV